MNRYREIFTESHCLSKNQLLGYIQGNLDTDEVYTIESHLNDCALCNAALEGLMDVPVETIQHDLNELKKDFNLKLNPVIISEKGINAPTKVAPIKPLSSNLNRWLVAASLLLFIGLGGFSVYSYFKNGHEHLALNDKDSKKTTPVDYSTPKAPDNELTQITVNPEDIQSNVKSGKDHVDHNLAPPSKAVNTWPDLKSKKAITEQDDLNNRSYAIEAPSEDATNVKEEVAAIIPEKKVAVDNMNDNAYSEAEKVVQPASVPNYVVSKKTKEGGMSAKSNNAANNAVPSNNNNYYNNNNNDLIERSNKKNTYSTPKYEAKQTNAVSDYQQAINLYNEGKYKKAIKLLESEVKTASGNYKDQLYYYLAQSHFHLNHYRQAEEYFTLIQGNAQYAKEAKEMISRMEDSKTKK